MTYKQSIVEAMKYLASNDKVLFIGQSIKYPGHVIFNTLEDVQISMGRRIELPVFEDSQMGMSIGLSLAGFIPVSIYPRMDFLIIAMNQLVNHLDKMEEMSCGQFVPKVIIRTMIGSKTPLNPGPQHMGNYIEPLRLMLKTVAVIDLDCTEDVLPAYEYALKKGKSTIIVERGDLYE